MNSKLLSGPSRLFSAGLALSLFAQILFAQILFAPAALGADNKARPNAWTDQRFRSWTTLRTQNVVLQRLDFSCGAASVATVLTFYMGKPVSEAQALMIVRARYTDAEWKRKQQDGLSLEDLAFIAERLGFSAQGGKVTLSGLVQLNGPIIVHLKKEKFQHFTVLRGIKGMTVYLADPFFGTVPMSLSDFIKEFSGAVLAIWDPKKPLPSDFILKLREQDAFYDGANRAVRPSFYERPRPVGPALF